MSPRRPLLVVVDDDPAVLTVLVQDLRRAFASRYHVIPARSGAEALELARAARVRDDPVALFLADQRMPDQTGVELLREARALFPEAGRVLLTAHADLDTALSAINDVHLDHFLLKPWDPPEERLLPVLRDLLEAWEARRHPAGGQIRFLYRSGSVEAFHLRSFLSRNLVPHRPVELGSDPEALPLLEALGMGGDGGEELLPLVLLPDGSYLVRPSRTELAERIGLRVRSDARDYDLVIVGGGPAGLAAAVYASSEGLSTLVVEGDAPGGQAGGSARIENYLGFPSGLSGGDLARRSAAQARRFGAEILTPVEALSLEEEGGRRVLRLSNGARVTGRAVVVATGVATRLLAVPGAHRLVGRGLHYHAGLVEALEVQGGEVALVGGGNAAGQAVLHLAGFARRVTLLTRGGRLEAGMSRYLVDRIRATENVEVKLGVAVEAVHGEERVEGLTLRSLASGAAQEFRVEALFAFIGSRPRTDWLPAGVARDPEGFLLSGPDLPSEPGAGGRPPGWWARRDPFWLESSLPGVFVAGDVRHGSAKRVGSAVGEGAMAVQFVHRHLAGEPGRWDPTPDRSPAPPGPDTPRPAPPTVDPQEEHAAVQPG